jgi:ACS family D-galactonate transporter-like MFS transporter
MVTSDSAVALKSVDSKDIRPVNSKRWITVGLLSLGAILAFISRTNISAALAYQPFIQNFHLSDIDRGTLSSAFFWSYAALQIPTGWLVDRYGVKIPYAISFVIW